MIEVFEPRSEFLKKYVNSIYLFKRSNSTINYLAYPLTYTPIALFRNAIVEHKGAHIAISNEGGESHFAVAANVLYGPLGICYTGVPDEIAINFKPLGFANFCDYSFRKNEQHFRFNNWDAYLLQLFEDVFTRKAAQGQLQVVEDFLTARFDPIKDIGALLNAVDILSDLSNELPITEVARIVGLHYKSLYRAFIRYEGCSPAHFRKIARFRNSVHEKLRQQGSTTLTEICYNNNYTDQSYFIKEYQELTGNNPKEFFKNLSVFGKNKVVWRIV